MTSGQSINSQTLGHFAQQCTGEFHVRTNDAQNRLSR